MPRDPTETQGRHLRRPDGKGGVVAVASGQLKEAFVMPQWVAEQLVWLVAALRSVEPSNQEDTAVPVAPPMSSLQIVWEVLKGWWRPVVFVEVVVMGAPAWTVGSFEMSRWRPVGIVALLTAVVAIYNVSAPRGRNKVKTYWCSR